MPNIHHRHSLLLSLKADTHYNVPQSVKGWVNLDRQHAALPYIILCRTTLHNAHECEKLVQGLYTAVEPRIYNMLVRRSTELPRKPRSHFVFTVRFSEPSNIILFILFSVLMSCDISRWRDSHVGFHYETEVSTCGLYWTRLWAAGSAPQPGGADS